MPQTSTQSSPYANAPYQSSLVQPDYAKPCPYVTKLSDTDEKEFQQWVKENKVPWTDDPKADYDMRGFWKGMKSGDPQAQTEMRKFDKRLHFSDKWKTPFHKTFSNESIYAKSNAPHWVGDRLISADGRVIADETP